ncbi:hypothetical protein IQ238_22845 [Pleurocapsales cyanobacterium LEGE 06147]|nr:hypothetical protein [Pleurocapsales cyanobacterium LEGE 06147]
MATAIATDPVSQVIAALIVGLLIAFGFQLLLTILGFGLGLSVWGFQPIQESEPEINETAESTKDLASSGDLVAKISIAAGFSVLLTINTVLFVACFLAIAFCSVSNPLSGATLGVTIWSAYLAIATWLGSKATTSVLGLVLSSAISGFGQIINNLSTLISKSCERSSVPLTEEVAKTLMGKEIQTALDAIDIRGAIEEYVEKMPQPQWDLDAIRSEFSQFLKNLAPDFTSQRLLEHIDRQTLAKSIAERTNLSAEDSEQLVQELDAVCQERSYSQQNLNDALLDFLRSIDPKELNLEPLWERLEQLVAQPSPETNLKEVVSPENSSVTEDNSEQKDKESNLLTKVLQLPGSLRQLHLHGVKGTLLERLDLTELDIEKILNQLYPFLERLLTDDKNSLSLTSYNVIQTDVEDYLLHAFPWQINSDTIEQEFREVLRDPEASPEQVRPLIEQFQKDDFVTILNQREDLKPEQVENIAARLEAVRLEVLSSLESTQLQEQCQELQTRLTHYLQTIDSSTLKSQDWQAHLQTFLQSSGASRALLEKCFDQWHHLDFEKILQEREDLDDERIKLILEELREICLNLPAENKAEVSKVVTELEHKLESYLRYTSLSQIVPEGIEYKLQKLIEQAQIHPQLLQQELPQFNRDKLAQILQRRKGLKASEQEKILARIQITWSHLLEQSLDTPQCTRESVKDKPPRRWAKRTENFTRDFWSNLTNYLIHAELENLSFEAIEQNLKWLLKISSFHLKPSKEVAVGLIQDLTQLDRTTSIKILSKRQDLTSTQIQQIGDRLDSVRQQLLQQAREKFDRLFDTIESFFRNVELPRLDYASLKEDLQALFANPPSKLADLTRPLNLLLSDKALDLEQLGEYLGDLSQEALKTALQARQDISDRFYQPLQEQVEGVKEWVKQKVDAIQQDLQNRTGSLKQRTLEQLEETRKAIATTIWWLFAIAFSSVMSSASAGVLAVKGIDLSFVTDFWSKFF